MNIFIMLGCNIFNRELLSFFIVARSTMHCVYVVFQKIPRGRLLVPSVACLSLEKLPVLGCSRNGLYKSNDSMCEQN